MKIEGGGFDGGAYNKRQSLLLQVKKEFDALCKSYWLDKNSTEYWTLFDMWLGFRMGQYHTIKTILSDADAYDSASALLQLESYEGGFIHLKCGGQSGDYSNPAIVEAMKVGLQEMLSSRVIKAELPGGAGFIIFKGYGGGDTGRALKVLCADCNPQEKSFSVPELKAIIRSEEKTMQEVKRLAGRKVRDKKRGGKVVKKNDGMGELPLLGLTATEILNIIKDIDFDSKEKQFSFVFDYMLGAGLLNDRPDIDKLRQRVNNEKERMVKDWLKSYRESELKYT